MFTEQLPDLLDYINNLPRFVCLVGDMNIHFDNPLQSLTKQTLTNRLVNVRSTYKIACLCHHCHSSTAPSYVTDMLHKSHCTPATLVPAHTPYLFSIDLHTVRQHLMIVNFLLLLLLSGTLFQMMSGVPHHCHHLCLV